MRRQVVVTLVSLVAGLVMAMMVAVAAWAIGLEAEITCPEAGSTPCGVDPFIWCRPLNGATICIREKT